MIQQETKLKQRAIINDLDVYMMKDNKTKQQFITETIDIIRLTTLNMIKTAGNTGAILGLSGGLDSFVVGAILAGIKDPHFKLTLVALPQGEQHDFEDVLSAIKAIQKINPNVEFFSANIGESVKAIHQSINNTSSHITLTKFDLGNVAARERMVMQYALANNQLVIGTDHATEAVVGYYTKYGDGGSDFLPIGGFLKDDLYAIAESLGAPESIMTKKPAAGLGISTSDEEELGLSYIQDIVPFLRGKAIETKKALNIIARFDATAHKRCMPLSAFNSFYSNQKTPITHVVIDCCNDFINGSLACQNAEIAVDNIIHHINDHPEQNVLYVQERHPENHCSFVANGGTWPPHCVEGTDGAKLKDDFSVFVLKSSNAPLADFNVFKKGGAASIEEYSGSRAFNKKQGFLSCNCNETVFISGIATEYCVKNTVLDFINNDFNVIISEKCLAYVNKEDHDRTLKELINLGVTVIYN